MNDDIPPKLAFNTNQMGENREDPRRCKYQSHFLSIRTEPYIETYIQPDILGVPLMLQTTNTSLPQVSNPPRPSNPILLTSSTSDV